ALAAVGGFEQRGILDAGVHGIRILRRTLEVPHALELPWMRRAVVPEVRRQRRVRRVVREDVAFGDREALRRNDRFAGRRAGAGPGLAAIVRALDDLAEPRGVLRHVDAVRVGWRGIHVVDLPAAEEGAVDLPFLARFVGGQDEGALAGAGQHADFAHGTSLSAGWIFVLVA